MKLVYWRRSLADLDQIAIYYTAMADKTVAKAVGLRIESVLNRIATAPESAPRVSQRSEVRVASVIGYPFQIFYRLRDDTIDVLYIRHTSRRPL